MRAVNELETDAPTCPMHPGSRVHRYRARGPKGPGIYLQCVPEGDDEAHLLAWPEEPSEEYRQVELSLTEIEVLRDAADGLTIDETAERRSKSSQTVKSQRSTVILKLNARNIAHAVAVGIREHLIEPSSPPDHAGGAHSRR